MQTHICDMMRDIRSNIMCDIRCGIMHDVRCGIIHDIRCNIPCGIGRSMNRINK